MASMDMHYHYYLHGYIKFENSKILAIGIHINTILKIIIRLTKLVDIFLKNDNYYRYLEIIRFNIKMELF